MPGSGGKLGSARYMRRSEGLWRLGRRVTRRSEEAILPEDWWDRWSHKSISSTALLGPLRAPAVSDGCHPNEARPYSSIPADRRRRVKRRCWLNWRRGVFYVLAKALTTRFDAGSSGGEGRRRENIPARGPVILVRTIPPCDLAADPDGRAAPGRVHRQSRVLSRPKGDQSRLMKASSPRSARSRCAAGDHRAAMDLLDQSLCDQLGGAS